MFVIIILHRNAVKRMAGIFCIRDTARAVLTIGRRRPADRMIYDASIGSNS
jgi:hypothetical protein